MNKGFDEEVKSFYKDKIVLVTGGTGMIGRQVVDLLVDMGVHVESVSKDDLMTNVNCSSANLDLTRFDKCKAVTKDYDIVFHLAGIKSSPMITKERPATFFVPLLQMNTNILEACRVNEVKHVIYSSSIGAYPSTNELREDEHRMDSIPMDTYPGWAKRMGELQIKAYKKEYELNYSFVRIGNCYGPGDNFDPDNAMVIPSIMAKIKRGDNPVKLFGNGNAIRDFVYSKDVAKALILALHKGTGHSFINLSSGIGWSIKELAGFINNVVSFDYEFTGLDSGDFSRRVMDITKMKNILGFKPEYSIKQGLEETWDWFNKNSDEYLKRHNYFKNK